MEAPLTVKELLEIYNQKTKLIKVTEALLEQYSLRSPDQLEIRDITWLAVDHYKISFKSNDPNGDDAIYYLELHSNGHEVTYGVPCFILSDEVKVTNNSWTAAKLKLYNSMQSTTKCGKCNKVLKEPYPGIKYCTICE